MLVTILFLGVFSQAAPATNPLGASAAVGCAAALRGGLGRFDLAREDIGPALEDAVTVRPFQVTRLKQALLDPRTHAVALKLTGDDALAFLAGFASDVRTLGPRVNDLLARRTIARPTARTHYARGFAAMAAPIVGLGLIAAGSTLAPDLVRHFDAFAAGLPEGTRWATLTASWLVAGYFFYRGVVSERFPRNDDDHDVRELLKIHDKVAAYRTDFRRFTPLTGPWLKRHVQFRAVLNRALLKEIEKTGALNPDLITRSIMANHDWPLVPPSLRLAQEMTIDLYWRSTGFGEPRLTLVVRLAGERGSRFAPER